MMKKKMNVNMENRRYKMSDLVNGQFLRFPAVFLSSQRYRELSAESKLVYMLLLDRMTLSQRNGWKDEDGDVYLVFPREEISRLLHISYRKAIASFHELAGAGLIYEQRCGLGLPNRIYVLKPETPEEDVQDPQHKGKRTRSKPSGRKSPQAKKQACSTQQDLQEESVPCPPENREPQKSQIRNGSKKSPEIPDSGTADLPNQQGNQIYKNQTDGNQIEFYPSITNECDEKEEIDTILEQCELEIFPKQEQVILQSAIERLYFSERLRLGGAVLPRDRIRSYLHLLSPDTLITALDVLRRNRKPVKNTIAYAMSVIFNGISQQFSDLLVCLPPEYQGDEEYADEQLPKGGAGASAPDGAASLRRCPQDPAPYFSGVWAPA